MTKINLIITGAVALFSSSLALAAMEQNTKWYDNISANVAVDVAAESEANNDSVDLDKGLSLGADYKLKLKHLDVVLGGKYFIGRDVDAGAKFSGFVLDASIKNLGRYTTQYICLGWCECSCTLRYRPSE